MSDREKVMSWLEGLAEDDWRSYHSDSEVSNIAKSALALFEEQGAKCLTKKELNNLDENQFVWIEGKIGYLYCLQIIGICRGRTGVSDITIDTPTAYVERSTNTYGKSYRIWTDKPTEEQSQAVKWE